MRVALVTTDAAALGGILLGVTHVLPEVVGTAAALLGCVWYGILIYDRLRGRKAPPE